MARNSTHSELMMLMPTCFLTQGKCSVKLVMVHAVSPRLSRYSRGLNGSREILMHFSLYQQMLESTT